MMNNHIEAAAAALWHENEIRQADEVTDYHYSVVPWSDAPEWEKDGYRKDAQAAITAYLAIFDSDDAVVAEMLRVYDDTIIRVGFTKPMNDVALDAMRAALQVACASMGEVERERDTLRNWLAVIANAALRDEGYLQGIARQALDQQSMDFHNQTRKEETGWLVEDSNNGGVRYRAMNGIDGIYWTTDPNEALRFARRVDAERFSEGDEDAWYVREHMWVSNEDAARATEGQGDE